MKSGSPPTARNARTGLFTPPGNSPFARENSFCDFAVFMPPQRSSTFLKGESAVKGFSQKSSASSALLSALRVKRLQAVTEAPSGFVLVRRGPLAVAGEAAVEDGGEVPRVDGLGHVQAALRPLPRELQLRRVGPGAIGRGRDLVAPGLDGAAHVSEPQVEIAQALARLERLWRRGVPLDQLSVLLRGAPRFVQVQGAEIAGELQGAAAHVVGAIAAIFAELEEDRARLDQGGVVVTRERQVARLLQLGGRAPAACAEQQGGDDSRPDGSSGHQEKRVPASRGRRNE